MKNKALMFQGTGSNVGKSLVLAGLCRVFANRGIITCPFKPQNMSNNAAVTKDGGEIGRAQALQAQAARTPLSVHMNPVLLKPQAEVGAQIVVQGKLLGSTFAKDYHKLKPTLMPKVMESFRNIVKKTELTLIEGAGSPAEINLRKSDIANMGFAETADIPVILVADIDRGGVIAQLVGTYLLLSETERKRTVGYIVNKFRGDLSLFDDGLKIIEKQTTLACLGIIPWFDQAKTLPKEDTMALRGTVYHQSSSGIKIAVLRFPRIANFDDLDPLSAEPDVTLNFIEPGCPIPGDVDLVLLPGSKTTLADLNVLRSEGWDTDIQAHIRRGGIVVGLCGGYQMLGTNIIDDEGIEGPPEKAKGLGLLNIQTKLTKTKKLVNTSGWEQTSGEAVKGYEMHIGITTGPDIKRPWLELEGGRKDGAISKNGQVMGCYLHGLFSEDSFRASFLKRFKKNRVLKTAYEKKLEQTLELLAQHLEKHLDINEILNLATSPKRIC